MCALLFHPAFYKVAVPAACCHDNRMDKANKTFDLLVIPGADHGSGGDYGERKRWDFFVHDLLAVEPPNRNVATAVLSGSPR